MCHCLPIRNPQSEIPNPKSELEGYAMGAKTRLFLLDDHEVVRQGLAALLGSQPDFEICGEAADEPTALRRITELRPDLVLVDLSLRHGSGLTLLRRIHESMPDVKLLVLSMHPEGEYAGRALLAGASGYVPKSEAADKLIDAIREVLAGRAYFSAEVSKRLGSRRSTDATGVAVSRLSDRELAVFELIGQGFGTREIAGRLHLSVKTIETYRAHLKEKLGLRNAAELSRDAARWVARVEGE